MNRNSTERNPAAAARSKRSRNGTSLKSIVRLAAYRVIGSPASREEFGVLGRQSARHLGRQLAEPGTGAVLDVHVVCEARGNPGVGPQHEAVGVSDEEL